MPSHRRKLNYKNIWIALFILSILGMAYGSSKNTAVILFYVLIGVAIYSFFKKRSARKNSIPEVLEGRDKNSEKHGCKCYMEGLSPAEKDVAELLSRELSYKDYFLFNNLILPSEIKESAQTDHIIISKFGIFVIESKDYQGWIFGTKHQKKWTQSLPGGKNKFQFQNPIHQNYAHIMTLKSILPFAENAIHGIIVFSDRSDYKTERIESVVNQNELIDHIKAYTKEVLSDEEVHLAIGRLSFLCQTLDISAEKHVENLNAYHGNHK